METNLGSAQAFLPMPWQLRILQSFNKALKRIIKAQLMERDAPEATSGFSIKCSSVM